jgi:ankyrin repeat protein
MDGYKELFEFYQGDHLEAAYSFLQNREKPVGQSALNAILLSAAVSLKDDWIELLVKFGANLKANHSSKGIIGYVADWYKTGTPTNPKLFVLLNKLISLGADPNQENPLKDAEQLEVIRFLVEHGALINKTDNNGMTPIMHQLKKHRSKPLEIINYFITAGADLSIQDNKKWTVLMHAVDCPILHPTYLPERLEVIKRILSSQQETIDHIASDGYCALLLAVEKKNGAVVELLVKHGANIEIRGPSGRTLLEIANSEIREILSRPRKASSSCSSFSPRTTTMNPTTAVPIAPSAVVATPVANSSSSTTEKELNKQEKKGETVATAVVTPPKSHNMITSNNNNNSNSHSNISSYRGTQLPPGITISNEHNNTNHTPDSSSRRKSSSWLGFLSGGRKKHSHSNIQREEEQVHQEQPQPAPGIVVRPSAVVHEKEREEESQRQQPRQQVETEAEDQTLPSAMAVVVSSTEREANQQEQQEQKKLIESMKEEIRVLSEKVNRFEKIISDQGKIIEEIQRSLATTKP